MIKEINNITEINCFDYKVTLNPFTKLLGYKIDNIVGFLDYSLIYEKIEINYIFVLDEYRNKNIAFKLVEYMIKHNDFENITLEVRKDNLIAIKLYESLGFKIIGERKNYYENMDAYMMEVKNEYFSN